MQCLSLIAVSFTALPVFGDRKLLLSHCGRPEGSLLWTQPKQLRKIGLVNQNPNSSIVIAAAAAALRLWKSISMPLTPGVRRKFSKFRTPGTLPTVQSGVSPGTCQSPIGTTSRQYGNTLLGKVKGKGLSTCYSAAYETRTAALYSLGSGS